MATSLFFALNSPAFSSSKLSLFARPRHSRYQVFHTPLRHAGNLRSRCPRVSTAVRIRCGTDVPSEIKRASGIGGGGVETDKLPSDVRERAMKSIDSCGGRVTIGDVASKAGLKLNEAEKALQAIAADTGGFLEVSDEGDVLYVFSRDYRSKLAGKSFKMKVEPLLEKSKAAAEYLIRVSFGTTLIVSIVLVYTTIIALLSSRSDEDNRGRRGGRSYDSGFTVFFRPSDLFWYWDPYYYRRRQPRSDGGMNFVESVFSFVFGDGDPNQGIEEDRWKLIGEYITSNGGVVAAEELAPYVDVPLGGETMDDESYILPVLLRFDGHPKVDDEGNILYCFPFLQRSAISERSRRKEYVGKRWTDWVGGVNKFFKERTWQFSKTATTERAMVVGLGVVNLLGVIILNSMLMYIICSLYGYVLIHPLVSFSRLMSMPTFVRRDVAVTPGGAASLAHGLRPAGRDPSTDRNVQWVFLGCPGVGKGTYASRLSTLLGVPHIATGDLVREELNCSGSLADQLKDIVNQGKLVSDEIIINLLSKRLEDGEAKGETGFILDGFPRTIRQAEILEGVTDIDLVVNLKLREDVLLAKCLGRRICSQCGGNFNVASIDIKGENGKPGMYMDPLLPPPHCASKLITRSDDTEEVVKERLRIYNEMSQPVEEFYRSRGKLLEFDLPGGIPESWPKLLQALNLDDHHDDKQSAAA